MKDILNVRGADTIRNDVVIESETWEMFCDGCESRGITGEQGVKALIYGWAAFDFADLVQFFEEEARIPRWLGEILDNIKESIKKEKMLDKPMPECVE